MQGAAIIHSPLPFLFGIKAEDAKARYWLRPLSPPNGADGTPRKDMILIEAVPKYQVDAQNYSRVRVYLDIQKFLPTSLEIFLPNWTDQNDSREVFEFANQETNFPLLGVQAALFGKQFIETDPPKGWKIIDEPAPANNLQAQQPSNNPAR